jgi:deaminated glutathione amidase
MSKIALAQVCASLRKSENLATVTRLIQEASRQQADLVAFPEFLMAYSPVEQSAEQLREIAENLDGEFVTSLREAAREHKLVVLATLYEKSGSESRVYDTAVLIGYSGELASVYRKLHLYDAMGFRESDKLKAGSDVANVVDAGFGGLGMMICYDVRFPELSRILALIGADVLLVPSGWVQGDKKVEQWETMLKARALENGCYVVAPNQVGNIYTGHSLVVDPLGSILLDMEEKQGLAVVEVDAGLVRIIREKLPLLKHRRVDVYAKYLK